MSMSHKCLDMCISANFNIKMFYISSSLFRAMCHFTFDSMIWSEIGNPYRED